MHFVDSWRLFGPNLQTRGPAALAEVSFEPGEDPAKAIDAWRAELSRMAAALGVDLGLDLDVRDAAARVYRGGGVLTFSAPLDVLLPATLLNEWAATSAAGLSRGEAALPEEPHRTALAQAYKDAKDANLLALDAEATRRGLPFVWDDDLVTVGAGARSRTWSRHELPRAEDLGDLPWDTIGRVPLALVTGTNGKTTSARLVASMLERAGHVVGLTTTLGVWVGAEFVADGDYTGPAGAALVLRRTEVDAAVLETARGGILRRGLAVRAADVALLTNVSDDHLGRYGIDDLAALARVKTVVGDVVPPSGRVVLNADDVHLMARARARPFFAPVVLFSLDPANPAVVAHRGAGGEAWLRQGGFLVRASGATEVSLVAEADVPLGFDGAAPYNLANALGAAATAHALGVTDDVIRESLRTFARDATDNPGRGNLFDFGSARARLLVDFAHNPAGIRGVLALARALLLREGGGRLWVVAGYSGDRSDASVRDAARAVFESSPRRVLLRELEGYLRGRSPGEMPALFRRELLTLGLPADSVEVSPSEADALRRALADARPEDLIVILAHLDSPDVRAVIAEAQGQGG